MPSTTLGSKKPVPQKKTFPRSQSMSMHNSPLFWLKRAKIARSDVFRSTGRHFVKNEAFSPKKRGALQIILYELNTRPHHGRHTTSELRMLKVKPWPPPPHPPRRHRPGAHTIFRRRRRGLVFIGVRRRRRETLFAMSSLGSFNFKRKELQGEKSWKFSWGVFGRADRAAAAITPAAARDSVAGPKNFFSLFDPANGRRSNSTFHVPSI